MSKRAIGILLAVLLWASPAAGAEIPEIQWESWAWDVQAGGLSPEAIADRPAWSERRVAVDGDTFWVCVLLPAALESWDDRVFAGTRQAQTTVHAFADYLVRSRTAADPADYQARHLVSIRHRLQMGVDFQSFTKVESARRPYGLWMRFGYPIARLEQAFGFPLPGTTRPVARVKIPRAVSATGDGLPDIWDVVWETGWVAGVVTLTVAAVLFAQATQK